MKRFLRDWNGPGNSLFVLLLCVTIIGLVVTHLPSTYNSDPTMPFILAFAVLGVYLLVHALVDAVIKCALPLLRILRYVRSPRAVSP